MSKSFGDGFKGLEKEKANGMATQKKPFGAGLTINVDQVTLPEINQTARDGFEGKSMMGQTNAKESQSSFTKMKKTFGNSPMMQAEMKAMERIKLRTLKEVETALAAEFTAQEI